MRRERHGSFIFGYRSGTGKSFIRACIYNYAEAQMRSLKLLKLFYCFYDLVLILALFQTEKNK